MLHDARNSLKATVRDMLAGLVVLQVALTLVVGTAADLICDLNTDEYGRPYYTPHDEPPLNTSHVHPIPPAPEVHCDESLSELSISQTSTQQMWEAVQRVCGNLLNSNECNLPPERCSGSSTAAQYDSRRRRCSCQNGVLVRCSRVRKEWHSLSPDERKRYINTVVTASRTYQTCFSYLISLHYLLFSGYGIHGGPDTFFLPWHRWYILQVENLLRQISPGITIPYWDWSLEANTWTQSEVWRPKNGFGGNGNLVISGYIQPDPNKPIRRRFNGRPHNCAYVALAQRNDATQYSAWHKSIENDLHDTVHCNIGGTMCTSRSADDPIFFLHHGFVDKLWADWQNKGPQYMNLAVWAQNNNIMPGGSTPQQVYNLLQQPQCVSVSIQQPDRPCQTAWPAKQLRASGESSSYMQTCSQSMMSKDYSPLKLVGFISRPIPEPSEEAFKLFHTSPEDQAIAKAKVKLLNNYDRLLEVLSENGYSTSTPLVDQVRGSLDLTSVIYRTLYLQSRNNTKCEL